jgi:hypothetical protein
MILSLRSIISLHMENQQNMIQGLNDDIPNEENIKIKLYIG